MLVRAVVLQVRVVVGTVDVVSGLFLNNKTMVSFSALYLEMMVAVEETEQAYTTPSLRSMIHLFGLICRVSVERRERGRERRKSVVLKVDVG